MNDFFLFLPCYQFLKISRINDLPIFLSAPPLVVGTPVLEAILDLKPLIPSSLFHENENPYFPLKPNIIIYCIDIDLDYFLI
jgi:hypothetical protein